MTRVPVCLHVPLVTNIRELTESAFETIGLTFLAFVYHIFFDALKPLIQMKVTTPSKLNR